MKSVCSLFMTFNSFGCFFLGLFLFLVWCVCCVGMWFWCVHPPVHTEFRTEYWVSSSGYYLLPWVRASQWPRSSFSYLASEFIGSAWFCSQCWGYWYPKLCQGFKVDPGIQIRLHLCRANALTHWAIPVLSISFYKIMASKIWVSQALIFYIKIID